MDADSRMSTDSRLFRQQGVDPLPSTGRISFSGQVESSST